MRSIRVPFLMGAAILVEAVPMCSACFAVRRVLDWVPIDLLPWEI